MATFLALDLGTSFIKTAVLDLDALSIQDIHRVPFPPALPDLPPLYHEVDPSAVVAAARKALSRLAVVAPHAQGIVVCSQMQGLVLTDAAGAPLSNCITWRDQRSLAPHPEGGSYFDALGRRLTASQHARLGELHSGLPVATLFTLVEQARLGKQVRLPPGAVPASLPDWVLGQLCHTGASTVEVTNGSVHGPLDLERLVWQDDVLSAWGLDGLQWPEIRRTGEVLGRLYGDGAPCYVPAGDQPCSLAGALLREEELSLNISTGSQASRISPRLLRGDYQTRPYFDGLYLNLITHVPAGRSLAVLMALLTELAEREGLALRDSWETVARMAAEAKQTDLAVNLAFFSSMAGNRGSISNIREDNLTVGTLFRAAFEDMATHYRSCAERLYRGEGWGRIAFSGGLAQKMPALRDVVAARLGVPYRLAPSAEDSLLGLLAIALVCSGRQPSVTAAIAHLAVNYIATGS
jgi:sugar (pentulose or hexulose) kinase